MCEPIQGGDSPKCQPRRHHERVIPPFIVVTAEGADERIEAENLCCHLADEQREKDQRSREQRWKGHERPGAKEVEGGEKSNCQRPQPTHPVRISCSSAGENHPGEIGWKDCFTPRPQSQCSQSDQDQHYPFRSDGGGTIRIVLGQPCCREW